MARPKSKKELIEAANLNFEKLWQIIAAMNKKTLEKAFDFSDDINRKEAHWKRDKNLRDVLIHLHEWHLLLLNWIKNNRSGIPSNFLPEPYNWKTYGELNVSFWERNQNTSLEEATEKLKESHETVMKTIESFSNDELFTKKVFNWTGATTLGSYCVSATSSHYDWALKKIKLHIKKNQ